MEMSNDFTGEFPVCGMIALKRGHAHWWALYARWERLIGLSQPVCLFFLAIINSGQRSPR